MTRSPTPADTAASVLLRSARRCAICYGLDGDLRRKKGQLAHIDQNPSHSTEDNLVFLCLEHHDEYDSKTRLIKGLTEAEVRDYKHKLNVAIERRDHERQGKRRHFIEKHSETIRTPLPLLENQLKLLREIELFFASPTVSLPSDLFAFDEVVTINAMQMAESYALQAFGARLNSPLLKVDYPAAHFHPDTPVILLDGPLASSEFPEEEPRRPWAEYFHWVIALPLRHVASSKRLHTFLVSPLLPDTLEQPLTDFGRLLDESVEAVRLAMNECAREMPAGYPTTQALKSRRLDLESFQQPCSGSVTRSRFDPKGTKILLQKAGVLIGQAWLSVPFSLDLNLKMPRDQTSEDRNQRAVITAELFFL